MRAVRKGALLVLLTLASCGAGRAGDADGEEALRVQSAVTDGFVDPGHAAVGAVHTSAGYVCSGTLVGARSVLTAAHCIAPGATDLRFVVEGRSYAVLSATPHPRYDPSTQLADVAVLSLDAAPPVEPSPLSPEPPVAGMPIVVVGLGCDEGRAKDCAYGTKRMTTNTVKSVSPDEIVFTSAPGEAGGHCDGDSGGPSLAVAGGREAVVGVHSWGPVGCRGDNVDARVDGQLAWIREQTRGDVAVAPRASGPEVTRTGDASTAGCAATGAPAMSTTSTTTSSSLLLTLVLALIGAAITRRACRARSPSLRR